MSQLLILMPPGYKVIASTEKDEQMQQKEIQRKPSDQLVKAGYFIKSPAFVSKKIALISTSMRSITKSSTSPPSDRIKRRFGKRILSLRRGCYNMDADYHLNWNKAKMVGTQTDGYIGSYSHRALMCPVLKAGSSTWHEIFWRLQASNATTKQDSWEKIHDENIENFNSLDNKQKLEIWKDPTATRIINVRHPFARLISGWKDKFHRAYFYNILFFSYPKLLNYPNKFGRWKGEGYFMEWKDFIHYLADNGNDINEFDSHFHPITSYCNPCESPFNFITKLETFEEDAKWILKNQLNTSKITLRVLNASSKKKKPVEEIIAKHFHQLSSDVIHKIYKIYENDFRVFGYTFNIQTLASGGWRDG